MRLSIQKRRLLGEQVLVEQFWVSLDVKAADALSAKIKNPCKSKAYKGFFIKAISALGGILQFSPVFGVAAQREKTSPVKGLRQT